MRKYPFSFAIGFTFGFLSVFGISFTGTTSGHAQPATATQDYAAAAWPHMTVEQRDMTETLARAIFERELSAVQRERIAGMPHPTYEALPEWRKMPFRGTALKRLGYELPEELRLAV